MIWHLIEIGGQTAGDEEFAYSRDLEFGSLEEVREYVEENMGPNDVWFLCNGDVYELCGPAAIEEIEEE